MGCSAYYNMAQAGFPYFSNVVRAAIAMVLGSVAFLLINEAMAKNLKGIAFRLGTIVFILVWVRIGVDVGRAYVQFHRLSAALREHRTQLVEGRVRDFQPARSPSVEVERFSVGNVTFSYSPLRLQPGFQKIRTEGNPIKDGDYLRVTYVGGAILQIETCKQS